MLSALKTGSLDKGLRKPRSGGEGKLGCSATDCELFVF